MIVCNGSEIRYSVRSTYVTHRDHLTTTRREGGPFGLQSLEKTFEWNRSPTPESIKPFTKSSVRSKVKNNLGCGLGPECIESMTNEDRFVLRIGQAASLHDPGTESWKNSDAVINVGVQSRKS